ncbi:MAG TPA: hypothetical protein VN108_01620 [Marmoricola sp.]|nr:hypothetical protein [Marmoricola sp.]
MTADSEVRALDQVRDRLEKQYPETSHENVELAIAVAYESLRNARIREFIPVLVEREAKDKLSHLSWNVL